MINGSWQKRSTTENTESTERYCFLCFLCALCGYKPFQEIIKSLMAVVNNFLYDSLAKVDLQPSMMFFLSKHVVDS